MQSNLYNNQMMKESNNMREKFREEIRQKHLNNMFRETRARLAHQHSLSFMPISPHLQTKIISMLREFLGGAITHKKLKNYQAIRVKLQEFEELLAQMPDALSLCINLQLSAHGKNLLDSLKKDIPETVLGELEDCEHPEIKDETEGDFCQAEIMMVRDLLFFGTKLHLSKFSLESAVLLLKALWNVAVNQYFLMSPSNSETHLQILKFWMECLQKLLRSPNCFVVKKHLTEMGLPSTINSLIESAPNFPIELHHTLLSLIDAFQINDPENHNTDMVGQILVLGTSIQYKVRYIVYCVYLLKQKHEQLFILSLSILDQLFNAHGYLVDHTKENHLFEIILQLVAHQQRRISVAALELLNTIVFYGESACDEMMDLPKNNILDTILARLQFEAALSIDQPYTKKSIQKCSNVLCDLLLTRDRTMKAKLFIHPVWQFIYHHINEHSPLFGTVLVFKYFFKCFGKTKSLKVLPNVLDAFAALPLSNPTIPNIEVVKQILLDIMYEAEEFWDQESHAILVGLLGQRGLMKYVDDQGEQNI